MAAGLDLKALLEAAQRISAEAGRVRDELAGKTVTAETGGGLCRCEANGKGEIVSITLDPAVCRPEDRRMIEDLVTGAVNLALGKARELAQEELGRATGGLPLPPGLFGG